ncbi:helix-turn-helix domain-containing protein [Corynebacterium jeikeium]|uniref:helix-turn-helix domain-containing protein n=1 Tax=Corynebacterium jeikeium TaxID=38289 RepID=UPI0001B71617|nr:PucR family transcriptional regulator [Corynebacterium jeikeium]EEW16728.1 hypothetical protein HMPREF0297_0936 [Corynebacterium jeikeium ATCC 43734]OOD33457.1 hypothetical protein BWP03_02630 [Corynebacterium jeikeium]WCZ52835.1 hypothetical protein CJEIK_01450 [Corynebacterium jeikeium]SUY81859.1 CdaR family transcriptional regulator [Corynebacterium jeikeium]
MDELIRKRFAQELGRSSEYLAERVYEEVSRDLPGLVNPAFEEAFRASSLTNVALFSEYVLSNGDRRTVRVGQTLRNLVRDFVVRGRTLSALLMLFHRGHNALESGLLNVLNRIISDLDTPDVIQTVADLRLLSNGYAALRTDQLAAMFAEESSRLQVPGDPGLLQAVKRVLSDQSDQAMVEGIGDYALDAPHVAFLMWKTQGSADKGDVLKEGALVLPQLLGATQRPLMVFNSVNTLWGWFAPQASQPGDAKQIGNARAHPSGKQGFNQDGALQGKFPDNVNIAIGPAMYGVEGFRKSHAIAKKLRRVMELSNDEPEARQLITTAMPGALSAAAFVDRLPAAREIVELSLGELATDDKNSETIRATARIFLSHSIAGTATELSVHRNTVKYRLEKFRAVVGEAGEMDADVRLALELAYWLGGEVLARKTR